MKTVCCNSEMHNAFLLPEHHLVLLLQILYISLSVSFYHHNVKCTCEKIDVDTFRSIPKCDTSICKKIYIFQNLVRIFTCREKEAKLQLKFWHDYSFKYIFFEKLLALLHICHICLFLLLLLFTMFSISHNFTLYNFFHYFSLFKSLSKFSSHWSLWSLSAFSAFRAFPAFGAFRVFRIFRAFRAFQA